MQNTTIKMYFARNEAMTTFTIKLTNQLVKHFNINIQQASFIIEDEWDYIEVRYLSEAASVESIAQELIDIYMVA